MTADQGIGDSIIRAQIFDSSIKQIAARMYKFKQAVKIVSTGAWKNYFFRENTRILAGAAGNAVSGIPRGAAFPQAVVEWERIQSVIKKYGLEDNIPWEDIISNEIDVRDRTLFKIAEGVTKSVDDEIWTSLGGDGSVSAITSFSIIGKEWHETSAAILDDLMHAKQVIAENNYPTENLLCFISPRDWRSIVSYLTDKGAQFPRIAEQAAANGNQGSLAGVNFVISQSVSASNALVVVPQICGTWKELVALQTDTKEDPFRSVRIRAVEMGVTQLTDPLAVVLIKGTQNTRA